MTAIPFLIFAVAWLALLTSRIRHYTNVTLAKRFAVGSVLWLMYSSILAKTGALYSLEMPPRLPLILLPMIAFWIWLAKSKTGKQIADAFPQRELIGLQSFRIIVEIFLHRLFLEGLLPQAMTYSGRNADIAVGVSALIFFVAWRRFPHNTNWTRFWNIAGLVLLSNVVITGILSVPGPLQKLNFDSPNLAVIQFPYVFVAALFVLSAVSLHILSLRKAKTPV